MSRLDRKKLKRMIPENEKFIKYRPSKNYCLVYGTVFSKEQQDLIYDFCKKRTHNFLLLDYLYTFISKKGQTLPLLDKICPKVGGK